MVTRGLFPFKTSARHRERNKERRDAIVAAGGAEYEALLRREAERRRRHRAKRKGLPVADVHADAAHQNGHTGGHQNGVAVESGRLTVPLPMAMLKFVEAAAERECRSVAGQVRFYVQQAMVRAGVPTVELTAWPPTLPNVSAATLPEARARLAEREAEIGRLEAADKANRHRGGLTLADEERLRFVRNEVAILAEQIRVAAKLQRAGVAV
jgi:hypothetical protein